MATIARTRRSERVSVYMHSRSASASSKDAQVFSAFGIGLAETDFGS